MSSNTNAICKIVQKHYENTAEKMYNVLAAVGFEPTPLKRLVP